MPAAKSTPTTNTKPKAKVNKQVVVVTNRIFTPYRENEVFSIDEKVAKKLLEEDIVRKYDAKVDAKYLPANEGVEVEESDDSSDDEE